MTNEMKRVPELRFSQFDKEWEKTTIADIGEFYYGRSAPKWSITDDATIPCVRYGELYTKHKGTVKEIYSYTNIERNKLRFSKGGEILIPRVGEDPMDFAKCSYLPFSGVAIGEMISVYNTDQNPVFITAYFNSQMKYEFAKRVEGASVSNLYYSYLKDINLRIPTIEEQQKIGDFFSELDCQIELEEQKLEKLEEQKKGYMQKIFSKELRFKDENGNNYPEWEEKNLKELIDVRDGTHESPKPSKDGYLLVTSKNLKNSKLDLSESYFISKEDYESINQRSKVEIGDILFGMIGTIGNPILLEECDFAIKNVALLKTNDLLEKYYILNFLKSSNISKQFYRMNAGGTQKFIALSTIRDLNIDMPSSEEAIKIGNFFNKVDNLIENQSNKLELLKKRKQGFLQKMFI